MDLYKRKIRNIRKNCTFIYFVYHFLFSEPYNVLGNRRTGYLGGDTVLLSQKAIAVYKSAAR